MLKYISNKIDTEQGFFLNKCADACFSPLYGILSLSGKERRVFYYSLLTEEFNEKPKEESAEKHCFCIQIIAYAALALLAIPSTLLGLVLKSISLCDPRLYEAYQQLWTATAYLIPIPENKCIFECVKAAGIGINSASTEQDEKPRQAANQTSAKNTDSNIQVTRKPDVEMPRLAANNISAENADPNVQVTRELPVETPKLVSNTAQQMDFLSLFDQATLFHCLFPYATIPDFLSIQLVSKIAHAIITTPAPLNTCPALFCLRKDGHLPVFQHLKSISVDRFGNKAMHTLFSKHFSISPRMVKKLSQHRKYPFVEKFSPLKMPCIDSISFTAPTDAGEIAKLNSVTIGLNTPEIDTQKLVVHKSILKEVHHWWVEHRKILSILPTIFRLHIKRSTRRCDEEILLIKYTLLTTRGATLDNRVGHEYLAFKLIKNKWFCFDSRSIKLLFQETAANRRQIEQFPPLFTNQAMTRSIEALTRLGGYIDYFMYGVVVPLFELTDPGRRPPTLMSPMKTHDNLSVKTYNNLPALMGHHSLEKMQTFFHSETDPQRTRYGLLDYAFHLGLTAYLF